VETRLDSTRSFSVSGKLRMAQSFLVPSLMGLTTIFYCFTTHGDSELLANQVILTRSLLRLMTIVFFGATEPLQS
jgi:hypothetical protein